MSRTQKDLDITRMSCLKSAAELVSAVITAGKTPESAKYADWTIKVADLFSRWVLNADGQRETVADAVQEASDEAKRKGRLSERTADRIREQVKEKADVSLKRDFSNAEYRKRKQKPDDDAQGDNGNEISPKQFRYLCHLNDLHGSRYSPGDFKNFTAKDASEMIDDFLSIDQDDDDGDPGDNGKGRITEKQYNYLRRLDDEHGRTYSSQELQKLTSKEAEAMIEERRSGNKEKGIIKNRDVEEIAATLGSFKSFSQLTEKQFRYLVSLNSKNGSKLSLTELENLSSKEASTMIDQLTGNGDR